ncbi:MAG: 30S ribosomal protein S17 [Candidatus Paceibacterota bacterium]
MAKIITGTVISTKMDKTVVVRVERAYKHPLYKKVIKKHKKYKAHSGNMELNQGDVVAIQEARPMSKEKRFKVVKKIS